MKVGPFSLQVVTQQHCNAHCPCDSALAQQLKQQLRCRLVAAQWRGDTALTLPFFWRRSTASSVFRVGARGRAFTPSPPLPPPPSPSPSLISSLASVDAKHNATVTVTCVGVTLGHYSELTLVSFPQTIIIMHYNH